MKRAVFYAGQGSQKAGMGADFYENFGEFREIFDNSELDFDLKKTCFEDPENVLGITKYTQPCITACTVGISQILKRCGFKPDYCAGLSLGEYAALEMAGVFEPHDVIKLTAKRGQAMDDASRGIECQMVAVLGLDGDELLKITESFQKIGRVSITNYNCPGQIVIGGEKEAVNLYADEALKAGASRIVPLDVSGPFHTEMMEPAKKPLEKAFDEAEFGRMDIPVVFNCLGTEKEEPQVVRDLLIRQLVEPVKMEQTISYLLDKGVREFIEIGSNRALSGFVKRTARNKHVSDVKTISIGTVEDLDVFLNRGVA